MKTYQPVAEKACTKCRVVKTRDEFALSTTRRSGLASWCRGCCRVYANEPNVVHVRKERRNRRYEHDRDFRAAAIVRSVYHRAAKIDVEFSLTKEWVAARFDAGCAVTGLPFSFTVGGREAYSPSVDRVDATRGYTPDNCRLVLWAVNSALGNWGMNVFLPIAEAMTMAAAKERAA